MNFPSIIVRCALYKEFYLIPPPITGLTAQEVAERKEKGLVNVTQSSISKSNFAIFRDNVLTLFNLYNLLIGIALALVNAWLNLFYLIIILANITIGIVQEVRGRNLVNKLSILTADRVTVVRGNVGIRDSGFGVRNKDEIFESGKQNSFVFESRIPNPESRCQNEPRTATIEIPTGELVLDDVMKLTAGRQICADGIVLEGEIEVNEAALTGESEPVTKRKRDALLSGSFVVSGVAYAKAEKVGAETFAAKLAREAKKHKKINSELLKSMRKVTFFTSFFIVPVGLLLFFGALFWHSAPLAIDKAVVSSSAALLGMLPKGLVLLISIALAAGVIKLAKKKVLVQEPYALETLARSDVLCLDKTGTITTGKMEVVSFLGNGEWGMKNGGMDNFISASPSPIPHPPEELLALFCAATDDNNATAVALKERFLQRTAHNAQRTMMDGNNSPRNNASVGVAVPGDPQLMSSIGSGGSPGTATPTGIHQSQTANHEPRIMNPLPPSVNRHPPILKTPFSSSRKWSSVTFQDLGTVVVGAPEVLALASQAQLGIRSEKFGMMAGEKCNDTGQKSPSAIPHSSFLIPNSPSPTRRVLYAAFTKEAVRDGKLPSLTIFAAIEISDPIRKNAVETFAYFRDEGVAVKVISGDNPATAAAVAKEAGLSNADAYVDMSALSSDEQIFEAAKKYTVFGRVTPEQKKRLVIALKQQGHTVAMCGDGVNDVLALREADCSIALGAGAGPAKQVSKLVLTESDFTNLPEVVAEGRRVVNNITKVSGIFFIKTLYSVLLSVLFIILNLPFPFLPIQITLIDLAIEGFPSLFLSFERETKAIKGKFLNTAILRAAPFAIVILLNICVLAILGTNKTTSFYGVEGETFTHTVYLFPPAEITGMMFLLVGFVSACAVVRACLPFNKLRVFLAATSSVGFFAAAWLFRGPQFLNLTFPSGGNWWLVAVMAAVSVALLFLLTKLLSTKNEKQKTKNDG
ncbi:MAG: HAD-IC family P-type ATPase [Firmicutes bacterium]|nr:HAD-IC family P-type ATPase [Bacillota bacterium]